METQSDETDVDRDEANSKLVKMLVTPSCYHRLERAAQSRGMSKATYVRSSLIETLDREILRRPTRP